LREREREKEREREREREEGRGEGGERREVLGRPSISPRRGKTPGYNEKYAASFGTTSFLTDVPFSRREGDSFSLFLLASYSS